MPVTARAQRPGDAIGPAVRASCATGSACAVLVSLDLITSKSWISLRLQSGKYGSWTYFNQQHMEFKNMDILTNKDRNWGPKQNSVKTCFGNWRMHTFHQRRTQTTKFMSFQVMKCPISTSQHHPWGLSPRATQERNRAPNDLVWLKHTLRYSRFFNKWQMRHIHYKSG